MIRIIYNCGNGIFVNKYLKFDDEILYVGKDNDYENIYYVLYIKKFYIIDSNEYNFDKIFSFKTKSEILYSKRGVYKIELFDYETYNKDIIKYCKLKHKS